MYVPYFSFGHFSTIEIANLRANGNPQIKLHYIGK